MGYPQLIFWFCFPDDQTTLDFLSLLKNKPAAAATTTTELQIRLMEYPQFSSSNEMEKLEAAWSQGEELLKAGVWPSALQK